MALCRDMIQQAEVEDRIKVRDETDIAVLDRTRDGDDAVNYTHNAFAFPNRGRLVV